MKKKVNGQVIDIKNIKLFELAFEGMVLADNNISNINTNITVDKDAINDYIDSYEGIYKSLPFPLYCIETNIKYAAIGMVIKEKLNRSITMWVDNALFIKTDEGKAIRFKGSTWGIVRVDTTGKEEEIVDIEAYSEDIGYSEFEWIVSKMYSDETVEGFYNEFMGEFVEACNNEMVIIKWELMRMLEFGAIPENKEAAEKTILDIENDVEYSIDIYSTGSRKNGKNVMVLTIGNGSYGMSVKADTDYVYNFDTYEKSHTIKGDIVKKKRNDLMGMGAVFEKVVANGGDVCNVGYKGYIVGDMMVYRVGNKVYKASLKEYSKPVEIAVNSDIVGLKGNYIYLLKTEGLSSGVIKETTYAVNIGNIGTKSGKLCRISFRERKES